MYSVCVRQVLGEALWWNGTNRCKKEALGQKPLATAYTRQEESSARQTPRAALWYGFTLLNELLLTLQICTSQVMQANTLPRAWHFTLRIIFSKPHLLANHQEKYFFFKFDVSIFQWGVHHCYSGYCSGNEIKEDEMGWSCGT